MLMLFAVAAFVCTLLAVGNETALRAAMTLKVMLLVCSVPLAASLKGERRTFWLAFAVAAWVFHLIYYGSLSGLACLTTA